MDLIAFCSFIYLYLTCMTVLSLYSSGDALVFFFSFGGVSWESRINGYYLVWVKHKSTNGY